MLKEIKVLQQQEHALQEESLSVRLRIEQIETTITEHNNKIKHWQKEVGEGGRVCEFKYNLGFIFVTLAVGYIGNNIILTKVVVANSPSSQSLKTM